MIKLVLGVLLWSITHFVPAVAVDFRKGLIAKMGEKPYKGLFTLLMAFSIYLIISGWKATLPELLYVQPAWGRHATSLFVLIAFILFGASHGSNNIRRFIRHPQLTAVAAWGIGHLLANGETRSVILFGGLMAWAVVEVIVINRSEPDWIRPEPSTRDKEIKAAVIALIMYAVIAGLHYWLGYPAFG